MSKCHRTCHDCMRAWAMASIDMLSVSETAGGRNVRSHITPLLPLFSPLTLSLSQFVLTVQLDRVQWSWRHQNTAQLLAILHVKLHQLQ